MRRIGIGIIGCGNIARFHAMALKSLEAEGECELIACADLDGEKAATLAKDHGIPNHYTDARAVIDHPGIEAIAVCTNPPFHLPATLMATAVGKHTIVEKPMTMDLAEADRAIEATRKANVRFGVIFMRRFWPAALRAHEAIKAGKIGRPISGDFMFKWHRDESYYRDAPWRGTWKGENGAALVNQAVHGIDMYLWLMSAAGPCTSVYGKWANLTHPYIECEDTAVAALRWENGALGVASVSISTTPTLGSRISITGETGATISVLEDPEGRMGVNDIWTIPGEEASAASELARAREAKEEHFSPFPICHKWQLQDFLAVIREGRDPLVTGEEGRRSIEFINAIRQSTISGSEVRLPL